MPTTYYVSDTNGNDGNDGQSQAQAKKTIGAALALATTDGDIVEIIDEATYDDESQLVIAAQNITLTHTASQLGRPIYDASGLGSQVDAINLGTTNAGVKRGFVLNGIEIKGKHQPADGGFPGSRLFDNFSNSTNANGMVISDCFIHGFSVLSDKSLQVGAGSTLEIQSSSFMFAAGTTQALSAYGPSSSPGQVIINNCFFSRSFGSTPFGILEGFQGNGGLNTTASFCTFVFRPAASETVGNSTPIVARFAKVINCVIRGPGGSSNTRGIKDGGIATDNSFNVVFDMGSSGVPYANSAGNAKSAGTGDRTDAVTFVNGSAVGATEDVIQSYALVAGSIGIDQGTAFNGVNVDINGTSRPQGSAPDMGAFELLPPYWQEADNSQKYSRKFGPSLQIRATENKLSTRRFPSASLNRQMPFFLTTAGVVSLRARSGSYKATT